MQSEYFIRIKSEVEAHPRERKVFSKNDIDLVPENEKNELCNILIESLEEGKERCNKPLAWLTKEKYTQELTKRLSLLKKKDHGYFFLSYFLHNETKDKLFLEKMKDGIIHGDPNWDMRRSALGKHLKNVLNCNREYADLCADIVIYDTDEFIKRTALLGIIEYKNIDIDGYVLPQKFEDILSLAKKNDPKNTIKISSEIKHILDK